MKRRKLSVNRHVLPISGVEVSLGLKPRDLNLMKRRVFKKFRLGGNFLLVLFFFVQSVLDEPRQPTVFAHLFISGNILLGRRRLTFS